VAPLQDLREGLIPSQSFGVTVSRFAKPTP
jgi:hypothetical protein